MPWVAMPLRPASACSTELKGEEQNSLPMTGLRASIFLWLRKEVRGKITQRCVSFMKPSAFLGSWCSCTFTVAQPWQTRVVERRITGVPCFSDSSKASDTIA